MKYIVKHTYTATEEHPTKVAGTKQIWYTGKGGHNTKDIEDFTMHNFGIYLGWSSKRFAEEYIEKDKQYYAEHENKAWINEWEIVAY